MSLTQTATIETLAQQQLVPTDSTVYNGHLTFKANILCTQASQGSNGYWPSRASTTFAVDPAAATPTPTAIAEKTTSDLYFVPAIAGLFVFVAIMGFVIILVLRKRP